jgi:tRNA pseudouridine32 synthase/23S rRNA pseudouridine746 synthase
MGLAGVDDTTPPRIVFADDAIVVVDKPSGMPSVPARTPLDPPAVAVRLAATFGPVEAAHRLDRDTSGLLVLARGRGPRATLGIAFERRLVTKRYLAIVVGQPPHPEGTVDLPLARDRDRPPRHKVDHKGGRPATTRWRAITTRRAATETIPTSLVALEPLTGRSHQLRIHLAAMGCPIMGDRLYGEPPQDEACALALHAGSLVFDHPMTGERLVLVAPPPSVAPWDHFSTDIAATMAAWLPCSDAPACTENVRPPPRN